MKTHKAMMKRFKITKNGKILMRPTNQDHFKSRDSASKNLSKRRSISITFSNQIKRRYIPN